MILKFQEDKLIKIQALWRGRLARRAFHSILRSEKPPFPIVRHFSGILNFNSEDYDKDLHLQVRFFIIKFNSLNTISMYFILTAIEKWSSAAYQAQPKSLSTIRQNGHQNRTFDPKSHYTSRCCSAWKELRKLDERKRFAQSAQKFLLYRYP